MSKEELLKELQHLKENNPEKYDSIKGLVESMNKKENVN